MKMDLFRGKALFAAVSARRLLIDSPSYSRNQARSATSFLDYGRMREREVVAPSFLED